MLRQPPFPWVALLVLGLPACTDPSGPAPAPLRQIIALQAGTGTSCAQLDDASLWCWGQPIGAVPAPANFAPTRQPVPVPIATFALGTSSLCVSTVVNSIYCWGDWFRIDVGESYGGLPTLLTDTLALVSLRSGFGHTCGTTATLEAICWGSSLLGKRGLGQPDPTLGNTIPNAVAGGVSYAAVVTGDSHSCGLAAVTGLVTCWGEIGRLGDSTGALQTGAAACFYETTCALAPQPVSGLVGITVIAAGLQGTCALGAAVTCWGDFEQPFPRPVEVSLPAPAAQITVGNGFACALTDQGQAYCWGRPGPWLGEANPDPSPGAVDTPLRFRLLAAGESHTCGVSLEDQLYCWGDVSHGILGPGLEQPTASPVRIRGPWSRH